MARQCKQCKDYIGIPCINGSCPSEHYNYFMSIGMSEFVKNLSIAAKCEDCTFYQGCVDCILAGTEYCEGSREGVSENGV